MSKFSDATAFLKALGMADDLDTFSGRKRVQKTVYLLKQFGADLKFGYTWYLHGPYSPELTRTLLNPSREDKKDERSLSKPELEIVNKVRNFLGNDFYSVDSIELVVSLIYLIKHGPQEGLKSKQKITDYLRHRKPQFSSGEIQTAWEKIEQSRIWESSFAVLD